MLSDMCKRAMHMSVAVYATSALCVGCLLNNVNECLCMYDSEEQSVTWRLAASSLCLACRAALSLR